MDIQITLKHIQYTSTWEDQFWGAYNSPQDAIARVVQSFLPAYAGCLDPDNIITRVTATPENGETASDFRVVAVPGSYQRDAQTKADVTKTAARFQLRAPGCRRHFDMRGLADSAIARGTGGVSSPHSYFTRASEDFLSALSVTGLAIRTRTKPSVDGFGWVPIIRVAPVADTGNLITELTTAGAHGLTANTEFYIGAPAKDANMLPLRGEWTRPLSVEAGEGADTFRVQAQYIGPTGGYVPKRARVRKLAWTLQAIPARTPGDTTAAGVFLYFTGRKTRDLDGARGADRGISFR